MKKIRINEEGIIHIITAIAVSIYFYLNNLFILSLLASLVLIFFIWFFRDPERITPEGKNLIISPADGKIARIKKVKNDKRLGKNAIVVDIFMSPFNVHVNRSPVSGRVKEVWKEWGKHAPAFSKKAFEHNKGVCTRIKFGKNELVVGQFVGILARRVSCWLDANQLVTAGQRIGIIKFGSLVKVVLSENTKVLIEKGEKVRAGVSVIGTY